MEKIYMIKYTLNRIPKNKLQKDIDEFLHGDDRFLLKESDSDKYKESVDKRIHQANAANRRCKPENDSYEIRYKFKDFPDDRDLYIGDSMFVIKLFDINPEMIVGHQKCISIQEPEP